MNRAASQKCKNKACGQRFLLADRHPFAIGCCTGCEIVLAARHIEKVQAARALKARKLAAQDRKETKAKIQALKGLSYWEGRAQHAVNKFIRLRDAGQPCISCDITYSTVWQAGHFVSVGANSTLRFHEDNIHLQCVQCNKDKGGNQGEYRLRLLAKIGAMAVDWLEGWHAPVKSTIEACQAIEARYNAKYKALMVERMDQQGAA